MEKNRHRNNILIIALVVCVFSLSISFSAFSQSLNISGTTNLASSATNWNISFGNITSFNTKGYATGSSASSTDNKSITFVCEFIAANDSCSITTDIINKGSIKALYTGSRINVERDSNNVASNTLTYDDGIINVDITPPPLWQENITVLDTDQSGTFKIEATLKDFTDVDISTKYTITIDFNFEQAENN